MGKKKKALLEFERFGKVRRKWQIKFAKLLEFRNKLQKKDQSIEKTPQPVEEEKIQAEEPVIETPTVEQEKPKTTRRRKAATKKTTTTKKATPAARKRRTTKTKTEA